MENGTAEIGVCVLAFFLSPRGCCMYPFLTLNLQICEPSNAVYSLDWTLSAYSQKASRADLRV